MQQLVNFGVAQLNQFEFYSATLWSRQTLTLQTPGNSAYLGLECADECSLLCAGGWPQNPVHQLGFWSSERAQVSCHADR